MRNNVKRTVMKVLYLLILTVFITALSLCATVLAEEVPTGGISGTGTESDPCLIYNAEGLKSFATMVNGGQTGLCAKLMADIVLNDETFVFNPDTGLVKVTDGINTAYFGTGIKGDKSGTNTVFDGTASVLEKWYVSDTATTSKAYKGKLNIWIPIGIYVYSDPLSSKPFSGTFDGNNHTVSGMYAPSYMYARGFFGYSKGIIKNLGITSSLVEGRGDVGGVCGLGGVTNCYNTGVVLGVSCVGGVCGSGSPINSYNTGIVIGSGDEVGGVCGSGSVNNCYNTGMVIGKGKNNGGVCGSGSANNCYNTGVVTGNNYTGGVCGSGSVNNCYNTGTVTGNLGTGGVCGYNNEVSITDCYNTGMITGISYVGGVCGQNNKGIVNCCYNTGSIAGSSYVGGVCGRSEGIVINCYYLSGSANDGNSTVQYGIGCNIKGETTADASGGTAGLTEEELRLQSSFTEFDFEYIWSIETATGYDYPMLLINLDKSYGEASAVWDGTCAEGFASGTGSETDPYIIETAEQLAYLAKSVNDGENGYKGKYIKLANDITLNDSSRLRWILNASVWEPISNNKFTLTVINTREEFEIKKASYGVNCFYYYTSNDSLDNAWNYSSDVSEYYVYAQFRGTFDGDGYSVKGVYTDGDEKYNGLFGYNCGVIKNVVIDTSYIKGIDYFTGGVCGNNRGTIDNCENKSRIKGFSHVGGVCGAVGDYGTVTRCHNTGTVTGSDYVGGVCGSKSDGTIKECHNTGTVIGISYVGGVCGQNYGMIANCYNTGAITGGGYVGGVCGNNCATKETTIITECYNAGTVTGSCDNVGGVCGYSNSADKTAVITDCYNTGAVTGICDDVGGVCGNGYATGCYNTGVVTGNHRVGGVSGSGFAVKCYNIGAVTGSSYYIGGVCGSGSASDCYNTGTVMGSSIVGGVCGINEYRIINCYNSGVVMGVSTVGGVCGSSSNSKTIGCYNSGIVIGSSYFIGGVCGIIGYNGNILNCYYLTGCAKDGNNTVQYGIGYDSLGNTTADIANITTGLTEEEMKLQSSFTEFDFEYTWVIEPETGYNYPQFLVNLDKSFGEVSTVWNGTASLLFASGTGAETDPYIIETAEQLAYLAKSVNEGVNGYKGKYIKLANDITLNESSKFRWILNASASEPIGNNKLISINAETREEFDEKVALYGDIYNYISGIGLNKTNYNSSFSEYYVYARFYGTFDGDGHSISGIYTDINENYGGLFGYNCGVIKNVITDASYITGINYIGGICGYNCGTIKDCVNKSRVVGIIYAGGLCGYNADKVITGCYNTGTVTGSMDYVGGVCGFGSVAGSYNTGTVKGCTTVGGVCGSLNYKSTVTDCYNTGTVIGYIDIGGVCGYNSGTVTNCYNVGAVTGSSNYVGGVCGRGSAKKCYYLSGCTKDGNNTVQYGIGCNTKGNTTADIAGNTIGLTDEQMKLQSSFTGFDFDSVWTIGVIPDYDYPTLRSNPHPHSHISDNWIIDTPATCVTTGSRHSVCTICGKTVEIGVVY